MDLCSFVADALWRPRFVYSVDDVKTHALRRLAALTDAQDSEFFVASLDEAGPLDDARSLSEPMWQVHGATAFGTRFFILPRMRAGSAPRTRVDVFITDQCHITARLHNKLEINKSVPLRDQNMVASLGISRYLCRILEFRFRADESFLATYGLLPFGSKILVSNIDTSIEDSHIDFAPNDAMYKRTKSIPALRQEWNGSVTNDQWPTQISVTDLDFIACLHDSVSIVELRTSTTKVQLVMKHSDDSFDHLYHELRFLLSSAKHDNIMPAPLHTVTITSPFGGKKGVIGFTLPYYELGSIREYLPSRHGNGDAGVMQKIDWSVQITKAICHVFYETNFFYSDLRPDNVLLSCKDGEDRLILCDFEQRGNWHEWCAPEVLFPQYVENLRKNLPTQGPLNHKVAELFALYDDAMSAKNRPGGEDVVANSNWPWFALTRHQQDRAQVYTLGLLMYCIFEGVCNVRNNIANAYRYENAELEFPHFIKTPPEIQDLIKRCTGGAPEWETSSGGNSHTIETSLPPQVQRVVRKDFKLYPTGTTDPTTSASIVSNVMKTGDAWWTREIERATYFFQAYGQNYGDFGSGRPTTRELLLDLVRVKASLSNSDSYLI